MNKTTDKSTKVDSRKTAKKAVKTESLSLEDQILAKQADLLEARRGLAAGELINPRRITALRKDIARLLTTANQVSPEDTTDSQDSSKENN